jgi:flagellar motor protein MotB
MSHRRILLATLVASTLTGCSALTLKRQVKDLRADNEDLRSRMYLLERDIEIARRAAERARDEAARAQVVPAAFPAENAEAVVPVAPVARDVPSDLAAMSDVEVGTSEEGLRIVLADSILFNTGSATISSRGKSALARLADVIRREYPDSRIRVDGHTDTVPIKKNRATWPTNWELAGARACAVVRVLVDRGVGPDRIHAASFGQQVPKASNSTPEGRRQNRRVEIIVLGE